MRDEGGAQGERVSDVAHAVLPVAEEGDDTGPSRLGDCLEAEP